MSSHVDDPQRTSSTRRNIFMWAAGTDGTELNSANERLSASSIGAVSIIAALVAAGGMGALTFTAFGGGVGLSVLVLVWSVFVGALVLVCNRAIAGSPGHRRLGLVRVAIPQIALALLIGIVVSQGVSYILFDSEIDRQISALQENEISDLSANVVDRADFVQRRDQINQNLSSAEQAASNAEENADSTYASWQGELLGTSTGEPGGGPAASALQADYEAAASIRLEANQDLDVARAEHTDQTRALDAAIAEVIRSESAEIRSNDGVLIKAKALEQVVEASSAAAAMRWTVLALVILILLMPILLRYSLDPAKSKKP